MENEESVLTILRNMQVGDWYLITHNDYHIDPRPACVVEYEKDDDYIAFKYRYFDDPKVREYFTNWVSDDDHDVNNDIVIQRTTKEVVADRLIECITFALSQGV